MRALKLGCIDAHRAKVTKAYVLAIPVFPSRLGLGSVDNDVCVNMQSKKGRWPESVPFVDVRVGNACFRWISFENFSIGLTFPRKRICPISLSMLSLVLFVVLIAWSE